jgi:hypothetical protein
MVDQNRDRRRLGTSTRTVAAVQGWQRRGAGHDSGTTNGAQVTGLRRCGEPRLSNGATRLGQSRESMDLAVVDVAEQKGPTDRIVVHVLKESSAGDDT